MHFIRARGSGPRTAEMWVDYALGGGSSGARTAEAGGSTESDGRSAAIGAGSDVGCAAAASVAGAHGAPRQPAGAHGSGQGDWSDAGCSPDMGPGIASGQSESGAAVDAAITIPPAFARSADMRTAFSPIDPGSEHA